MGAVHFSIDLELTSLLQRELGLTVFVETGTFRGETIERVHPLFSRLHTVEYSEELYAETQQKLRSLDDVEFVQGDSPEFLRARAADFQKQPVLFWLDAHWCNAAGVDGEKSQCPLLEELAAIESIHPRSVVWIDDARLFLAPPDAHAVDEWPRLPQVIRAMTALSESHQYMVLNDTILLFPCDIREIVEGYAVKNGIDWLMVMQSVGKSDDYALRKQLVEKEEVIQRMQAALHRKRSGRLKSLKRSLARWCSRN